MIHINVKHVAGFTIIGNHLAQHHRLSLVAIGLAVHIQSLPAGAKIGIKVLAARFPESEARIAVGLRQLEATGYLHRSRERLPNGRIITRTVSYNQPGATAAPTATSAPQPQTRRSQLAPPWPVPQPAPTPVPQLAPAETPHTAPQPAPAASPAPALVPAPTARRAPAPPLPQPQSSTPELHQQAAALLADLRRHVPQLVLSESDIRTLTPGVVTWLERNTAPGTIRHTLTADLPVPLKHPAKLLRHRITALLPPPLPGTYDPTPLHHRPAPTRAPECEDCGRPFYSRARSQYPTHCRDCRDDLQAAA